MYTSIDGRVTVHVSSPISLQEESKTRAGKKDD